MNNVATYGRLYRWDAVNDSRNIAPVGWHVPSDAEWQTLVDYLGGSAVAGGKMKEAGIGHWKSPNTGATNESGFSALPGGSRNNADGIGKYSFMGEGAFFWSAKETYVMYYAWNRELSNYSSTIFRNGIQQNFGFSVRCVMN